MDVDPTIRTSREERARRSLNDFRTKWAGTYEHYLLSSLWRANRDGALRRAKWKCQRCESKRGLQVHHRSYEYLGCERDEDLEVLCARCHEGHHAEEAAVVQRVYLAVVSDCLHREKFRWMADLVEAVKVSCATKKIPYDGEKVYKAIRIAEASRRGVLDAPKPRLREYDTEDSGPGFTKSEAREFCINLGFAIGGRYGMEERISNQEQRVRAQAHEIHCETGHEEPTVYRQITRPRKVGRGRHAVILPNVRVR